MCVCVRVCVCVCGGGIIALVHQWQHECSSFKRRTFFSVLNENERMVIHYAFR